MLQHFQRYCTAHHLYRSGKSRWLLAVSGGIDSMVLAHLCRQSTFEIGIAHCNFTLRGAESDADEIFVKRWAQEHQVPFYTIAFNTKEYAAERGVSTQMAARDLRYAWFEELRESEDYTDIVVAHHADDNAETLLLNLTRGTGIKGMRGMQPVRGRILRPLLFATRSVIAEYAAANGITYREDASNKHDDYARNRIRHHVIPELQKINPAFTTSMWQTALHFTQAGEVIDEAGETVRERVCRYQQDEVHISIDALTATPHYDFWLFELLQPYGFTGALVDEIMQALDAQPGKRFRSTTHELIKDRTHLIVVPYTVSPANGDYLITYDCEAIAEPLALRFEYEKNSAGFSLKRTKDTACLDASKLEFPLTLRLWRDGDVFVPFGMKGIKKVSDFLIDEKVPLHEKEKQYVLLSGKDIVWVVGRRIGERYKVAGDTKKIVVVTQI